MKDLDKSKIYDLRDLNQEERNKLAEKTNNPYVEKINEDTMFLSFYKPINHWQVGGKTNNESTNAKELFEPEYEVKYIAEQAKEHNEDNLEIVFNPQQHYFNELKQFRSLFELSHILELNEWEFDILKRLVRCRKKGQFAQDIQKIKDTADIYLNEFKEK